MAAGQNYLIITLCVVVVQLFLQAAECRSLSKRKRETNSVSGNGPFVLPPNFTPNNFPRGVFPNPLLPMFPFSHHFGFGLDLNPGSRTAFNGNLGFPIIDDKKNQYYPWNLGGGFGVGSDNLQLTFNELLNPANTFNVSMNQLYQCLIGQCTPQQQQQSTRRSKRLALKRSGKQTQNY